LSQFRYAASPQLVEPPVHGLDIGSRKWPSLRWNSALACAFISICAILKQPN